MTTNPGFGKSQPPAKVSKRSTERAKAAKQYERMKTGGTPDFEIYIRIEGKKNWYLVGVIAVKRSGQINQAIFDSQEDLLGGALRLYPILRKNKHQLEYGYRLKEFKDEPIQVAVPTQSSGNGVFQTAINQVKDGFSSLLKRT
ncbi:HHL1-like protein [Lyngbya aestuarii]|uniref:HHL1-like protein n=1 Tax=Lyngbya aestuarii TaxID=118322 RepID=UPI00403DF5F2